jgi:hypothetical protein
MTPGQRTVLIVLGGAALLLIIAIIAIVIHNSSGGGTPVRFQPFSVTPTPTPTPTARAAQPTPALSATPSGPTGRTSRSAAVRQGPDSASAQLATLATGISVAISGRSDDNQWFFVTYPIGGGSGSGWIDAASLTISGDLNAIPILVTTQTATPSPSPSPSPSPTRTPSPSPTPSPAPTQPPTQPPRQSALPDLTISDISVIGSGPGKGSLEVVVANLGMGDVAGQPLEIIGYDQTGAEVLDVTTGQLTIAAGKTQPVITGYQVKQRQALTIVINPNHAIAEADAPPGFADPNNTLTKTVSPP